MKRLLIIGLLCSFCKEINAQEFTYKYHTIAPFCNGMSMVSKDGKFGFIDMQYKEQVALKYTNALNFSDGLAAVATYDTASAADSTTYWIFIDSSGKQAVPGRFESVEEDLEVTPSATWTEGLAIVWKQGDRLVINKKGETIVKIPYGWQVPFRNGFAIAESVKDRFGLVDLKGKPVISLGYDAIAWVNQSVAGESPNSPANSFIKVRIGKKWGIYNTRGKRIVPIKYDAILSFSEGLACVERDGKWGYIDANGKEIIAPKYDNAAYFFKGRSSVSRNGFDHFINQKGEEIEEEESDVSPMDSTVTKEKAEQQFLTLLNGLVTKYVYKDRDNDVVMVDSPFVIRNGVLSGLYKTYTLNGISFSRRTAPLKDIKNTWLDLNWGFNFYGETGTIETSNDGETNYSNISPVEFMHIASPGDGAEAEDWHERISKALELLKTFYP